MNIYKITIGDPWNYKSKDGTNNIQGCIIKEFSDGELLFETTEPLNFEGIFSDKFILHSRYSGQKLKTTLGYQGSVNGGIIQNFVDSFSPKEIKDKAVFAFIGELEKIN